MQTNARQRAEEYWSARRRGEKAPADVTVDHRRGARSELAAARATEPRIWNYHWVVLEGLLIKSQRLDDVTRSLSHGWDEGGSELDDSLMSARTEWPDNSGTKRDTGTARPSNGTQIKWLIENSQNTPFSKIKYYWCFVLSFSLGGRC